MASINLSGYGDRIRGDGNIGRMRRARLKLRAQGLRPIQIWVPDIRAPGFAEELSRQCRAEAAWAESPEGRAEPAFWDKLAAETWPR